jgi:hypothetical protein
VGQLMGQRAASIGRMDSAIAGFIGAIAGALGTIGTQATLAWLHRRNESRTSARLLYGDVKEAGDILEKAVEAGGWHGRRDLAHVLESWRQHREPLARAVRTGDFHTVAGAFQGIEVIQLIRERNAALADEGFSIGQTKMGDTAEACRASEKVLGWAGATGWEHNRVRMGLPVYKGPEVFKKRRQMRGEE